MKRMCVWTYLLNINIINHRRKYFWLITHEEISCRIFYYIVKEIDQDWSECVINDSYKSTMISMADLSRRFANTVFSIYAFSAFFLSVGEHLLQSDDINQFGNNSRELPIKMEFPFDVSKSPIFECFLIGQFLYDLVIAFVVGLINALLVALVSI